MDDFDLHLGDIGGKSPANNTQGPRRPKRVVRRHDVPDLTPPEPFEDNTGPVTVLADNEDVGTDTDDTYQAGEQNPEYENTPDVADNDAENDAAAHEEPAAPRRRRRKPQSDRRAGRAGGVTAFLFDRRFHIFVGIFAILIAGAMTIVLCSHLRNAAEDQSLVLNNTVAQIVESGKTVNNTGGAFGAWLGHALFTDALGLGAFVIAIYLFAIGGCLIAKWKINFWSFTFKCLLTAITVSVVAGLVTATADTAVLWGGTHGRMLHKTLFAATDWMGPVLVTLVLLVATVCAFYYPLKRAANLCAKYMPRFSLTVKGPDKKDPENPGGEDVEDEYEDKEEVTVAEETPQDNLSQPFVITQVINAPAEPVAETPAKPAEPAVKDTAFTIDDDTQDPAPEPTFEVERPELHGEADDEEDEAIVIDGPTNDDYDPHASLPRFKQPGLDLLEDRPVTHSVDQKELDQNKQHIVRTLANYKISVKSIKATVGPTITLYEIVPVEGTRISSIKNLEDDIAMSLKATGIRIIAPMPGRGTVGIEVPNSDPQIVSMRQMLASPKFTDSSKALPVALGATISNEVFVMDVASMPHALVAGATGQGKSVGLNAIIASLIYKKHPADLKFVLIDPKSVEFSLYAKLEKHYLAKLPDEDDDPIVIDTNRVLAVLNSLCVEMDQRYALMKEAHTRDIKDYNRLFISRALNPAKGHKYMPYIVVIIDEFADLIMTAGKEIEGPVTRITQKARAVGIHMIIATQRPSTNVLTGLIKANCPARIAFRVNQMVDSRTILDRPGANRLVGRGDMLYSAGVAMERVQCAFISTDEVERICDFVNNQVGFAQPYMLPDPALAATGNNADTGTGIKIAGGSMDRDVLFDDCARFLVNQQTASTSILQRRFNVGYNRAGKIIDQLEACGVVGPGSGNKPRQVLVDSETLEEILSQR